MKKISALVTVFIFFFILSSCKSGDVQGVITSIESVQSLNDTGQSFDITVCSDKKTYKIRVDDAGDYAVGERVSLNINGDSAEILKKIDVEYFYATVISIDKDRITVRPFYNETEFENGDITLDISGFSESEFKRGDGVIVQYKKELKDGGKPFDIVYFEYVFAVTDAILEGERQTVCYDNGDELFSFILPEGWYFEQTENDEKLDIYFYDEEHHTKEPYFYIYLSCFKKVPGLDYLAPKYTHLMNGAPATLQHPYKEHDCILYIYSCYYLSVYCPKWEWDTQFRDKIFSFLNSFEFYKERTYIE